MLINLSELFSCQGKEKTYTQSLEMEHFHGPLGDYEIAEKEPAVLQITHLKERKLKVRGEVRLTLMIPCGRCLEPVGVPFHLTIEEELDMNQSHEDRVEALDQLVSGELMANLPMKVLCKEDCKGICPQCGRNLNLGECGCEKDPADPRMAAIQDIFKQFKEV